MLPFIIIGSILLIWVLVFVVSRVLARKGVFGTSPAQAAEAALLAQTGVKARAWVLAVEPSGMVVNSVRFGVNVLFRLDPIHGGPSREQSKRMVLPITQLPRLGDCWPAWFDGTDPTKFAVGVPNAITPEQIALYREFGIVTPFSPPLG